MRRAWPILLVAVLTLGSFVGIRIQDTTPISLGFHWAQAAVGVAGVMLVFFLSQLKKNNPSPPQGGEGNEDLVEHSETVVAVGEGESLRLGAVSTPAQTPTADPLTLVTLSAKALSSPSPLPHMGGEGNKKKLRRKYLLPAVYLLALALPFISFIDRELLDLATLVLIYALLASGLNIVVGFAGLLDLGFIAFFAIGAYTYGILGTSYGFSFWLCLPLAALTAAFTSLLLGLPVLRLRGDYFAIVTLGFGQIVYTLLLNWRGLTHGSQGIGGIARPGLPGLPSDPANRVILLYYIILVLAAAVFALVARLRKLPIGRAWEALREDEIAAASLGLSRSRIKLAAYAISAAIAGLAGAFFAARQGFISPESFTFMDSAIVLAIVVLGGSGRGIGLLLAAALLIGLPELIRPLADYRMLIFGALLIVMMRVRPRGLFATRPVSVRLS
jgi:ABC-type branched-subunit amino acid transport system permease subunit